MFGGEPLLRTPFFIMNDFCATERLDYRSIIIISQQFSAHQRKTSPAPTWRLYRTLANNSNRINTQVAQSSGTFNPLILNRVKQINSFIPVTVLGKIVKLLELQSLSGSVLLHCMNILQCIYPFSIHIWGYLKYCSCEDSFLFFPH